jgi:ubiquinone/menaquinone biosynthesis C-methylase UbiE
MRLNWLGRASMNNAVRAWGQRYAASRLERLGGRIEGRRALEVGCGRGVGAEIILEKFGAASVEAIDLDPKMVDRARRRLAAYDPTRVRISVGNVTSIQAADSMFDAVFDFGAIHLEPQWRQALGEVRRVLKPGGKFFFEWVTDRFLRLPYPLVTENFRGMGFPDPGLLIKELEERGLVVGQNFVRPRLAAMSGFVGDLVGVARLAVPTRGLG